MTFEEKLANVNIEDLDAFEETYFHDYSKRMSKVESLQKIIDNAQGDYNKLSNCLADIVLEEKNE
jgi:hypothetical protein